MSILRRRKEPAWKKIAAGAAGGLAGTLAMSGFQALWSKVAQNGKQPQQEQSHDEPATVKAAEAIVQNVVRRPLPDSKKGLAGNLTHYAFGTLSGAIYGAVGKKFPFAEAGRGTLFGAGLWALADEFVVPALRLSKPVGENPPLSHIYGLASHLVYGVTADSTAKLVRRML